MIAKTRIWRWRTNRRGQAYIEVTEPGQRVDWVTADHVYVRLEMVVGT